MIATFAGKVDVKKSVTNRQAIAQAFGAIGLRAFYSTTWAG